MHAGRDAEARVRATGHRGEPAASLATRMAESPGLAGDAARRGRVAPGAGAREDGLAAQGRGNRLLEKGIRVFRPTIEQRCAVIAAAETTLPMRRRFALMDVAKSTFHRWRARGDDVDEHVALRVRIRALHQRWHGLLGYRRMHEELAAAGMDVAQRTVRRLMAEAGLHSRPAAARLGMLTVRGCRCRTFPCSRPPTVSCTCA